MKKYPHKLSEKEIDEIVIKEADDLTKWEKPIAVKMRRAISLQLSPELVQKAKFLAETHKAENYREWLENIIRERIELEEDLLQTLKSDLAHR